jgi:glutathionylspermidine synthase
VNVETPTTDYASYVAAWDHVARAGRKALNVDTWASGRRYLSLASVCLTLAELSQLRELTVCFTRLIDRAVEGILHDPDWWSALAWPWPAIELARQEPPHPGGHASATLLGRFDCLLDLNGTWQVIEYNADTPSGVREATGLEPAIAQLHPGCRPVSHGLSRQLVKTLRWRLDAEPRPGRFAGVVGIVSSHSWLEDMAQATWLSQLLRKSGVQAIVGDVTDLTQRRGRILLRGTPIDALYRYYPVERLYRHPIFASLCEASIDGRLLLLNGLRSFLAQSKVCLAWLWANRSLLNTSESAAVERHLPHTLLARDPAAAGRLHSSVVKHVNGREGDSVVFGATLDPSAWEARLLEGGYVVQRAVVSPAVSDVDVDDLQRELRRLSPRYACVGAFCIGGRFGGCYTRLDGPITSARATYAATLLQTAPAS